MPISRFVLTTAVGVSILGLTACASTGGSPAETPIRTVAFSDAGQIQTTATSGDRAIFDGSPDRVMRAVDEAYRDLGIEPTTVNAATRQVGNASFVRRRQFGSVNLSRYFECGNSFTGSRADDDRLTITMQSTITDAGGGRSEVKTVASAVAKPMDGTGTLPADCGSTGRLEQVLKAAITKRLGSS